MRTYLADLMQCLAGGGEVAFDMITIDGEIVVNLHEDPASLLVWAYASPGFLHGTDSFANAGACWSATAQPDPAVGGGMRTLHVEPQTGLVLLAHGWPHAGLTIDTFKNGIANFAKDWRSWASLLGELPTLA